MSLLARAGAVQARERLHSLQAGELAVDIHGAELRLVEAGLVFLGDDQDLVLVRIRGAVRLEAVKAAGKLGLGKTVQPGFGVGLAVDGKIAGEGDKRPEVRISLRLDVVPEAKIVPAAHAPGSA